MLRWLAPAPLLLVLVGLLGCDSGPECVVDTDCSGLQICVEEACVPLGEERDSGTADASDEDAGEVDDAGVDMGPEPGSVGTGNVVLESRPAGADPATDPGAYTVSAGFYPVSERCSTSTVGGCQVVTCAAVPTPEDAGGTVDAGTPEPEPLPHAGAVQVSGGSVAVTLMPTAAGTYDPATGAEPLFSALTDLVVTAPGDEVPSFRTTGLQGVAEMSVDAPAVPDTRVLAIDFGADLALSWTAPPEAPDDAVIYARATSGAADGSSVVATCTYPVAGGAGTVEASVLGMLGANPRLRVVVGDVESIDRDGWLIEVLAFARVFSEGNVFDVSLENTPSM